MIDSRRVRALIVALVAVLGLGVLQKLESQKTKKDLPSENISKDSLSFDLKTNSTKATLEKSLEQKPTENSTAPSSLVPIEDSFDQLIESTEKALTRVDDLRKLDHDEIHATPLAILKSAAALGDIAERVKKDSKHLPRAIEFYADCATSEGIAQTIRALCLARYQHHSNQGANSLPPGEISDSIIRLARHVEF